MKRTHVYLSAAALALTAVGAAGAQQQRPLWEFGIDGTLAHRTTHDDVLGRTQDESFTQVELPVPMVRAGLYLSENVELEPVLGIQHSSAAGGSATQLALDVGLPIYVSGTRATDQIFVRPLIGFDHFSGTGTRGFTQTSIGAGVGVKIPIDSRIASRLEAQYRHGFDSGPANAYDQIALLVGLSVYSR